MTDEDMLMEQQLALADLASLQRQVFAVRALHRREHGHSMCNHCFQEWPCGTRKVLDP